MDTVVNFILNMRNNLTGPLGNAGSSVRNFQGEVNNAQGSTNALGSAIGKIGGLVAGAFAVNQIVGFGKTIVSLGADMEVTRLKYDVLLGSAERSKAMIDSINTLANKTPYDNDQLLNLSQQLLTVGVDAETVTKKMEMLGNIASMAPGDSKNALNGITEFYSKNFGQGNYTKQDVNQLATYGIPVKELLKYLHLSRNEFFDSISKKGGRDFKELEGFFDHLYGKGGKFGNMNDRLSATLEGQWSNFKGALNLFLSEAGESASPYLKSVLAEGNRLLDWVKNNKRKIGEMFMPLIDSFKRMAPGFKSLFKDLGVSSDMTVNLAKAVDGVKYSFDKLSPVLSSIGDLLSKVGGFAVSTYGALDSITKMFSNGHSFSDVIKRQVDESIVSFQKLTDSMGETAKAGSRIGNAYRILADGLRDGLSRKEIDAQLKANSDAGLRELYEGRKENEEKYRLQLLGLTPEEKKRMDVKSNNAWVDYFGRNIGTSWGDDKDPITRAADRKNGGGAGADRLGTKIGDVSGTRQTTLNINIAKQVGVETLALSNITNLPQKVKDELLKAMVEAVIDVNAVGAQGTH